MLPYEKPDKTWLMVSLEMDMSRIDFTRSRYTIFDMLSDVGGLSGIFFSVFTVFMAVWNFNSFDNYMVTHLFKAKFEESQIDSKSSKTKDQGQSQSEFYPSNRCPNFKDYFLSCVPSCLLCCKQSRREKAFTKARDKLEKEMNIIELIKSQRYFA